MATYDLAQVLVHLGANVSRIRKRRGYTQAALAEAAGVELRFLQRIERGSEAPSLATVVALAGALGAPVSGLFRPARPQPPKTGRPRKKRSH